MEYLSFRHHQQHFAVPISSVRFIAAENALPPTQVATGNSRLFTMVEYDGQACPVLSLARLLHQPSASARSRELLALLQAREQDHRNWLAALKEALQHGRPFDQQRDPDQCAFGRWYLSFTTTDPQLQHLLGRFDAPHRRLHALAGELLTMSGREQALAILHDHEHSTLVKLQELFAEARELIQGSVRPTVIMLQSSATQVIGLKVDDVGEVFDCGPQQADALTDFLPGFGKRWLKNIRLAGHEVTVMEISPARLLSSASDSLPETDRL